MKTALATTGLAMLLAVASSGTTLAFNRDGAVTSEGVLTPIVQQRIDTESVLIPPRPTGPATPHPFCSPGAPICP